MNPLLRLLMQQLSQREAPRSYQDPQGTLNQIGPGDAFAIPDKNTADPDIVMRYLGIMRQLNAARP